MEYTARSGGGHQEHLRSWCNNHHIRYNYQPGGSRDFATLERHARTGALVTVQTYDAHGEPTRMGGQVVAHALIVVGVRGGRVHLWDPSSNRAMRPDNCLGSVPVSRFIQNWYGNSWTPKK
jgi:hypothetical protein